MRLYTRVFHLFHFYKYKIFNQSHWKIEEKCNFDEKFKFHAILSFFLIQRRSVSIFFYVKWKDIISCSI